MYGETTKGISTSPSALRMPEPEVKIGEVARECNEFAAASKRLELVTTTLENALTPILKVMNGPAGSETAVPEPVRVPLAATIHQHAVEVDAIANRLQMILSRIEL